MRQRHTWPNLTHFWLLYEENINSWQGCQSNFYERCWIMSQSLTIIGTDCKLGCGVLVCTLQIRTIRNRAQEINTGFFSPQILKSENNNPWFEPCFDIFLQKQSIVCATVNSHCLVLGMYNFALHNKNYCCDDKSRQGNNPFLAPQKSMFLAKNETNKKIQ